MPGKARIYFDTITPEIGYGEIKAVSPAEIPNLNLIYQSFEVPMDEVLDIMEGKKAASHYCVVANDGVFSVIIKEHFDVTNRMVVPALVKASRVLGDPEIIVTINYATETYSVRLGSAVVSADGVYKGRQLDETRVFITDVRNPAFLMDEFVVDYNDLSTGCSVVQFVKPITRRVDVFVSSGFKKIGLEEQYDASNV